MEPIIKFFGGFGALLGAIAVYWAMLSKNKATRCRATLDTILKTESNKHYKKITEDFRNNVNSDDCLLEKDFHELLDVPWESEETRNEQRVITPYLNHNELIAVGLDKKILDDNMYRSWMFTSYTSNFLAAFKYIYFVQNFELSCPPVPLKNRNKFYDLYEKRFRIWASVDQMRDYRNIIDEADKVIAQCKKEQMKAQKEAQVNTSENQSNCS